LDSFNEDEYKEILATIEKARLRGLIGASKYSDSSLGEVVNIANDILWNRDLDEVELSTVSRQPKALYVYIALVAVGLISA
jgi:hypothetical protein